MHDKNFQTKLIFTNIVFKFKHDLNFHFDIVPKIAWQIQNNGCKKAPSVTFQFI